MSKKVTEWDIADLLADAEESEKAATIWKRESECREWLTDRCGEAEIAEEAVWIQKMLSKVLDQHAKQLWVTAYSKRWWGPKIQEGRSAYARAKRAQKREQIEMKELKKVQNKFYRIIHQKKRECWEKFIKRSEKELGNSLEPEDSARC